MPTKRKSTTGMGRTRLCPYVWGYEVKNACSCCRCALCLWVAAEQSYPKYLTYFYRVFFNTLFSSGGNLGAGINGGKVNIVNLHGLLPNIEAGLKSGEVPFLGHAINVQPWAGALCNVSLGLLGTLSHYPWRILFSTIDSPTLFF